MKLNAMLGLFEYRGVLIEGLSPASFCEFVPVPGPCHMYRSGRVVIAKIPVIHAGLKRELDSAGFDVDPSILRLAKTVTLRTLPVPICTPRTASSSFLPTVPLPKLGVEYSDEFEFETSYTSTTDDDDAIHEDDDPVIPAVVIVEDDDDYEDDDVCTEKLPISTRPMRACRTSSPKRASTYAEICGKMPEYTRARRKAREDVWIRRQRMFESERRYGKQQECCIVGCERRVKNRLRHSLKSEHDFKEECIRKDQDRICHHHYFKYDYPICFFFLGFNTHLPCVTEICMHGRNGCTKYRHEMMCIHVFGIGCHS